MSWILGVPHEQVTKASISERKNIFKYICIIYISVCIYIYINIYRYASYRDFKIFIWKLTLTVIIQYISYDMGKYLLSLNIQYILEQKVESTWVPWLQNSLVCFLQEPPSAWSLTSTCKLLSLSRHWSPLCTRWWVVSIPWPTPMLFSFFASS